MEHRELSNGYAIPSICYGTDIVDYRTTITEKLNRNLRFWAKSVTGRGDTSKLKKDRGIIKCSFGSMKNGCNFFDTSRAYGGSEKMLQAALKGKERDSYYILTSSGTSPEISLGINGVNIPPITAIKIPIIL